MGSRAPKCRAKRHKRPDVGGSGAPTGPPDPVSGNGGATGRPAPAPASAPAPAPAASSAQAAPASAATRLEQEVVARASHEREKEERLRWQYYASIPQKHWRAMSGRQTKVINEQAERYGLPFGGPSVNLPAFVRAFHDFLADNAIKLAKDDDLSLGG